MTDQDSPIYVVLSPPDELLFTPDESRNSIRSSLHVTNATGDSVLFKIKTTFPNIYSVHPSHGVLDPNASVSVAITGTGVDSLQPNHKFQVLAVQGNQAAEKKVWVSNVPKQMIVLASKLLPSAEFLTMRSFTSFSAENGIGKESLEVKRVSQELRGECDQMNHELEDLRRKVRVAELGVSSHRDAKEKKTEPSGFGNMHVLVAFLLGVVISFFLIH